MFYGIWNYHISYVLDEFFRAKLINQSEHDCVQAYPRIRDSKSSREGKPMLSPPSASTPSASARLS